MFFLQIGEVYPCYHSPSNRSTTAQWKKPSFSNRMRDIFYLSIGAPCCFCWIMIFGYDIKNRRHRYIRGNRPSIRRNMISMQPIRIEEDVGSTPPPPYETLRLHADGQQNNPLIPPPPYSRSAEP